MRFVSFLACCFLSLSLSLSLPFNSNDDGGRKRPTEQKQKCVNSKSPLEQNKEKRKRKKESSARCFPRRRQNLPLPLSPTNSLQPKPNSPVVESCPASTTIAVALPVAKLDSTASLARNSAGGPRPSNIRSTTSSRSASGCAVGSASMKGCSLASRRSLSFRAWSQRASTASQSA